MININPEGDVYQSENLVAHLYLSGINRIELILCTNFLSF